MEELFTGRDLICRAAASFNKPLKPIARKTRSGLAATLGIMNIKEAIAGIRALPEGAMLFAERIDGKVRPESECAVADVAESEISTPADKLVEKYAPGKHYFLEVPTVIDILEAWSEQRDGAEPSLAQAVEAVISTLAVGASIAFGVFGAWASQRA